MRWTGCGFPTSKWGFSSLVGISLFFSERSLPLAHAHRKATALRGHQSRAH
jgi:hypothetical protein